MGLAEVESSVSSIGSVYKLERYIACLSSVELCHMCFDAISLLDAIDFECFLCELLNLILSLCPCFSLSGPDCGPDHREGFVLRPRS